MRFLYVGSVWLAARCHAAIDQNIIGGHDEEYNYQFTWSDITPSKSLKYSPCYSGFQCARLEVPMDWNSTDPNSERLAIAVIKLPARVPITDPCYGGAILVNPGGPGGSGVAFAERMAKPLQRVVDAAYERESYKDKISCKEAKYFDIISFDPRAVNHTTPFHTCFQNQDDSIEWFERTRGIIGTDEMSFSTLWARYRARSQGCVYDKEKNPSGVSKIARFASTPMVVRDMVEIIERHGEWREAEANIVQTHMDLQTPVLGANKSSPWESSSLIDRLRWRKGEEQLNYWGFSYGTVLGATFATLQPHRAARVILDGVDDADDYYSGSWQTNLRDSDKVMENFFAYCAKAGPAKCAMHIGSTPDDIRGRWKRIVREIEDKGPIPVPGNAYRGPDIISLSDIKELVRRATYQPLRLFKSLADVMAPLSERNGTAFADRKHRERHIPSFDSSCKTIDPNLPNCNSDSNYLLDAGAAILCLDGGADSMVNITRSDYKNYWARLRKESMWIGDAWAMIRMICADWPAKTKWKLPHPIGSNATAENATLFVGNTHDNVTPLWSAKKMASRFKGSSLLHVDIDGHTSLANPSLCAGKTIRQYFQTGQVPSYDAGPCLPHLRPFLGTEGPNVDPLPPKEKLPKQDEDLLEALQELSGGFMGRQEPDDPDTFGLLDHFRL